MHLRTRILPITLGLASILACGESEPSEQASDALTGDQLLGSTTTLNAGLSCGKLYSGASASYLEILRTGPLTLHAGQAIYAQARLTVTSNSNDNQMVVIRVRAVDAAGHDVHTYETLYGGRNHIGKDSWADKAIFSGMLYRPTAEETLSFVVEGRAGQTGCGPGPTTYCTAATGCGTESLNIVTGAGYTYLSVWSVDPASVHASRFTTWAAGYANLTTANSPYKIFNNVSLTVPAGKSSVDVTVMSGNTMDNTLPTTQGNWRLHLAGGGQDAYFPSVSGLTTSISRAEHHHQILLEGHLGGLSPGQVVTATYEVETITAPPAYLHVDTGYAGVASSQTAMFMVPKP
ncbi:MAG: hypothetical protein U1E65_17780 [Myxococcota bacterium]